MEANLGQSNRIIVIGLDGATWNIIEPMVQEGKLPTIEKLTQDGCYGNLESCIPSKTFPAWKCYSTGKNPGKLGVYGFANLVAGSQYRVVFNNSTSFKSEELWDILGRNGISCGVLDMPTTYPPKEINGFMVSNAPPRPSSFVYPGELEGEIKRHFDYKTEPDHYFESDRDAAIRDCMAIIQQRFEVASYLLKKFDPFFFHLTIFEIDTMQHYTRGKPLEDAWVAIDNGIKSILDEHCDKDTYVILMSDHGHTDRVCNFQIARWLESKGLSINKNRSNTMRIILSMLGLRRDRVIGLAIKTGTLRLLRNYFPKIIRARFLALLPTRANAGPRNPIGGMVDQEKSKVIPFGGGGLLYINQQLFSSQDEYDNFRTNLISELKGIADPRTGVKLAQQVYKAEELYSGPYLSLAPDIVVAPTEGYMLGNVGAVEDIWVYPESDWTRCHRLQGIFTILGPDIKQGFQVRGARIYDLAPTILHLFGTPIPQDMDGRVLQETLEEGSELAIRELTYQRHDERTRVRGKIKGLKATDNV
jgi:predicted AlkP superfamily phosphohydrolase/phosphomutase